MNRKTVKKYNYLRIADGLTYQIRAEKEGYVVFRFGQEVGNISKKNLDEDFELSEDQISYKRHKGTKPPGMWFVKRKKSMFEDLEK